MDVINFKPILKAVLSQVGGIAKTRTDYPTIWTTLPTAVYRTTQTSHKHTTNGDEIMTKWDFVIEIYSTDSLSDITEEVRKKLNAIGFRGNIKDANGEGLIRSILSFSGVIDNETRIVYRP